MTTAVPPAPPDDDRGVQYRRRVQHDVMRGSLWTVVGAAVSLPVSFVVNLLVVHSLGAQEYGRFAVLTLTYTIALAVAGGGVSDGTTQWLAAARATGDRTAQRELVRRCSGYHLLVQTPLLTTLTVVLLRHEPLVLTVAAAAATALIQALSTSAVVLTASARNALAARLLLATTLAVQTSIALTAGTGHTAAATWAASIGATLVAPILMFACIGTPMRRAILKPLRPARWPAGFGRYTVAAWLGALVGLLVVGRSEIFVLQAHHDLVAVALFAVAAALAAQITLPLDSVMGPLLPAGAGLVALAPDLAVRALHRAVRTSALLGAVTAGVALPLVAQLLPTLYGNVFAGAVGAFAVLGLASCLTSVAGPVAAFGYATRAAPALLRINLVALASDLVVTVALVPVWGLAGAVAGNAVGQVVRLALLLRVVAGRLGVAPATILLSARGFLLGPVVAALALAASTLTSGPRAVAVAGVVGTAGVLVGLRLLPGLRLSPGDGAAISTALPGPLQRAFTAGQPFLVRPAVAETPC